MADFNFEEEAAAISEEIKQIFAKQTLDSGILKSLQQKVQLVIDELNRATVLMSQYKTQKQAFKRLQASMSKNFENEEISKLSEEDFINRFNEYKANRSRTFKTEEDIRNFFEARKNVQDTAKIKSYLVSAYQLIMDVRDNFKEHIEYRVFIMGGDKILMASPSLKELANTAKLTSNLDLQLSMTTLQIKEIIDSYDSDIRYTQSGQLQKMFSDEKNVKLWNVLTEVRQKIVQMSKDGKKIYYNFGQLIEALVYLQNKEITSNNIYDALLQGQNTISFEKKGDFILDGVDVQSKVFYASGSDSAIHRIRLMSVSGVKRVLNNINNALKQSVDFNSFAENLSKVFSEQGEHLKSSVLNSLKTNVMQEIDKLLADFG